MFLCLASRVETWDRWTSLGGRWEGAEGGSVAIVQKQKGKMSDYIWLVDSFPLRYIGVQT